MTNIATFFPNPNDATSFYRGAGPFGALRKLDETINCQFISEVNWSALKFVDIMFLQRPWTPTYRRLAQVAKRNSIPLWIDFDDDLFNVPSWNPAHIHYSPQENQDSIRLILSLADVVTVTTPKLKELYAPYNDNIIVIPNAWDDYMFPWIKKETKEFNKLITWRGSNTHRKDLNLASAAAITLNKKYDFTWMFLGDSPWFADFMKPELLKLVPSMDIIDYFHFIKDVKPGIFIVPLKQCEFNESKSAIAFYEATYAGAITLAPTMSEWRLPGIINYEEKDGKSDFGEVLENLMQGQFDFWYLYEKAFEHIKNNFLLSNVNTQRIKIINDLIFNNLIGERNA